MRRAKKPDSARAAGDTAAVLVNVFDGRRRPIPPGVELLIHIFDGNQKKQRSAFVKASSIRFPDLPFFDNFGDNYRVIVSAGGYLDAGFYPVPISPAKEQRVDLMLLPKDGRFVFRSALWTALRQTHPQLVELLARGAPSEQDARDRYGQLLENRPASLAAFLNLTAAMAGLLLPDGGSVLEHFKQLIWDDSMQPDRFFAYAGRALIEQVGLAARQGVFKPELPPGGFHPGATSSFKEVRLGEGNLQLTFHEGDTRVIDGLDCVKVEADIDYYKDLLAHGLLEVLPNWITKQRTNPQAAYMLRWTASRQAGLNFNPPYTIEA